MLTREAIAFSELGQAFRGLALDFADEAVTDEETLGEIRSVYEKRLRGRITRFVNVTLDDGGNFKGRFEQYVNPRLTKRFSFIFGSDEIQFKALNADDIEKFSEGVEDFAKTKRDAKNFKCKIGPCGGRCLKGGEACRQTMTPEEKRVHDKALRNKGRVDTSLAKKRREMKAGREKTALDAKSKASRDRDAKDKAILDKAQKDADSLKRGKKSSAAAKEITDSLIQNDIEGSNKTGLKASTALFKYGIEKEPKQELYKTKEYEGLLTTYLKKENPQATSKDIEDVAKAMVRNDLEGSSKGALKLSDTITKSTLDNDSPDKAKDKMVRSGEYRSLLTNQVEKLLKEAGVTEK